MPLWQWFEVLVGSGVFVTSPKKELCILPILQALMQPDVILSWRKNNKQRERGRAHIILRVLHLKCCVVFFCVCVCECCQSTHCSTWPKVKWIDLVTLIYSCLLSQPAINTRPNFHRDALSLNHYHNAHTAITKTAGRWWSGDFSVEWLSTMRGVKGRRRAIMV